MLFVHSHCAQSVLDILPGSSGPRHDISGG
jgi:hypothetical protein